MGVPDVRVVRGSIEQARQGEPEGGWLVGREEPWERIRSQHSRPAFDRVRHPLIIDVVARLALADALATHAVITERRGPQVVPFSADPDEALASLANIEQLEAHWLLPGHGSPWTDGVAAAVVAARNVGIGHLARPKR